MIGWTRAFPNEDYTSPSEPIVTPQSANLEMIFVSQKYLDSRNAEAQNVDTNTQLTDDTMMKPWMRFFSEDGGVWTTVAGSAAIAATAVTILTF